MDRGRGRREEGTETGDSLGVDNDNDTSTTTAQASLPTARVQILGFPSLGLSLPTCELGVVGMPVSQVRGEGGMRLDTEQALGTHVSPGTRLLSFRELAGPGLRLDQPGVLSPLCVPSCV